MEKIVFFWTMKVMYKILLILKTVGTTQEYVCTWINQLAIWREKKTISQTPHESISLFVTLIKNYNNKSQPTINVPKCTFGL